MTGSGTGGVADRGQGRSGEGARPRANRGVADPVHNDPACPGGFASVTNPSTDAADGPDALVCASCGALVDLEEFGGGGR